MPQEDIYLHLLKKHNHYFYFHLLTGENPLFFVSPFLTAAKRELLTDFALPIAVITMSLIGSLAFKEIKCEFELIFHYYTSFFMLSLKLLNKIFLVHDQLIFIQSISNRISMVNVIGSTDKGQRISCSVSTDEITLSVLFL